MTSNADEFSAEAMPAWMLDPALDPPTEPASPFVSDANSIVEASRATLRCEHCGEYVDPKDVSGGGHVVTFDGHADDASCRAGDCANCPVQEQDLCGPVVEVQEGERPDGEESDATFTAWGMRNANNISEVSTLTFDVKPADCSHPWEANKHRGQVVWCGLCGYIRYA